jgi:hypothetical protein
LNPFKLRVSEKIVMRRIVGPKKEEVTVSWRILHSDDVGNVYSLPNTISVIRTRRVTLWGMQKEWENYYFTEF